MQVNVKAVSDALDSILIEERGNKSAIVHQKPTSAIIQRYRETQPKITSNEAVSIDQRHFSKQDVNLAASASAEKRRPESTERKGEAPLKASDLQHRGSPHALPSSPSARNSRNDTDILASAGKKASARRPSRSRAREGSPSTSPLAPVLVKNADRLFEMLSVMPIIDLKVVEGTGLGVGSALITARGALRRIEKQQLPSNSWVTNTALSPAAVAVFKLTDTSDLAHRRVVSESPAAAHNWDSIYSRHTRYQDAEMLIFLEDSTQPSSRSSAAPSQEPNRSPAFRICVETSSSQHSGYVTAATTTANCNTLTTLTVPGTLLSKFVRVTVDHAGDGAASKLIKVRAICAFWAESWTSKTEELRRAPPNLEEEAAAAIVDYRESSQAEAAVSNQALQTPLHLARGAAVEANKPAEEQDPAEITNLAASSPTGAVSRGSVEVAEFVKEVALSHLRNRSHKETSVKDRSVPNAYEYNWLSDTLEATRPCPQASADADGRERSNDDDDTHSTDDVPELSGYIGMLQSWNAAPSWSEEKAMAFCLSHTTSFSLSAISPADFITDTLKDQLQQPFKTSIIVCSQACAGDEGKNDALFFSSISAPPLHYLSAFANHTVELGLSAELLFTCGELRGFCCALRSKTCDTAAELGLCKLVFVVTVSPQELHFCSTGEVVNRVLTAALAAFSDNYGIKRHKDVSTYGALRMVVDRVEAFEALAPVMAKWASAAGPFRYYGVAAQPLLQLLFFPTSFGQGGRQLDRSGAQKADGSSALWESLHLQLLGLWSEGQGSSCTAVALQLQAYAPAVYVWQSAARQRVPLRLVLTEAHIFSSLTTTSGLVLPPALCTVADSYAAHLRDGGRSMPPYASFSEAPWADLVAAAEELAGSSMTRSTASVREATEAFFALRKQVTVSFAFHLLSTAFKRGWATVSACMPTVHPRFQAATKQLSPVCAQGWGSAGCHGLPSASCLSLLDEDAFMDTFVQWHYPLPRLVALHCTSVLAPAAGRREPCEQPAQVDDGAGCTGGVDAFFSHETLCQFAAVASLAEALTG